MRSVAEGPKGRATGAFPRVTESARPDMHGGSVATVAHIVVAEVRRARKPQMELGLLKIPSVGCGFHTLELALPISGVEPALQTSIDSGIRPPSPLAQGYVLE
jgi:hypothetical protein